MSLRTGQWILAGTAFVLLGLHTFSGQGITIDGVSFGLLGVIALAAVLPSVINFTLKVSREGIEAQISRVVDRVEQIVGKEVRIESTPALAEARTSPVESINLSRKALAEALRRLIGAAGLSVDAGSIAELATSLQSAGHLTPDEVTAITQLATTFDAAISRGEASTASAVNSDFATQLLVATLNRRVSELGARPSQDQKA